MDTSVGSYLTDNGDGPQQQDWPGRWSHIEKILERNGPLAHPDFEASSQVLPALRNIKILVVGAGGLGCELLKNLALMGFRLIDVIDMDTIDLSNLNRQFLFRHSDIGKSKAEVAANFVNTRVPGCKVTPHHNKIQDFDEDFYRQFNIAICGLDSIVARRWMNAMICSLLNYDDGNNLDQTSLIPIIDGGTEGFKGNARVILPGITACVECTLDLYPPQINFPLCTIAHTPRLPEHCIEYVKVLLWSKDEPFGKGVPLDGDNPEHVQWVTEKASERAASFSISGVTYRLAQGVIKHIIPAVASTNAVIAATCTTEAFKLATSSASFMNNYMVFNDSDGIYSYTYEAERKENCLVCSTAHHELKFPPMAKLQEILTYLIDSIDYQMQSPGVRATTADGKSRTLFMKHVEQQTKPNLNKTLTDLGLFNGQEIIVVDKTSPNPFLFKLTYVLN